MLRFKPRRLLKGSVAWVLCVSFILLLNHTKDFQGFHFFSGVDVGCLSRIRIFPSRIQGRKSTRSWNRTFYRKIVSERGEATMLCHFFLVHLTFENLSQFIQTLCHDPRWACLVKKKIVLKIHTFHSCSKVRNEAGPFIVGRPFTYRQWCTCRGRSASTGCSPRHSWPPAGRTALTRCWSQGWSCSPPARTSRFSSQA